MNTMLLDHPALAPEIDDDLTRRRLLSGIGALGLSVTLAGCAEDEDAAGASASAPAASPSPTGAFPVRIDHKFGTTEIPAEPARVVTVGVTEQDPVLALGVAPVGITEWFGDKPFAVWPWARDELSDDEPQVLSGELNVEAIAALRPDLIVGTHSGITAEQYGLLARIAPTLARASRYAEYEMPWQEQTLMIGRALGRLPRAEALIAGVESMFSEARDQLSEYAGSSAVIVNGGPSDGNVSVYTPNSFIGQLLGALGLVVPPELEDLAGDSDQAPVSLERLDLLDRDLLVWNLGLFSDRSDVEALPLYQQLDAVDEGRDVFITDEQLYAAVAFNTVLSLPFALDRLVPLLAAALDGDPATTAAPASDPSPSATPTR